MAHRRDAHRLARTKRAHRAGQPRPEVKRVVFVVGCQRSGTTLAGRILDRMMEVDHFPETDPRAFHRVRIRGKAVRDKLIAKSTAHCIVFKPIADSHRVLELMAAHAGSRALWVYRQWRDVVNSAVAMWGEHWRHVVDGIVSGTGDWGWRQEGISSDCLATVREMYRPNLTADEAMAVFWYLRNRIYFDMNLGADSRISLVRYEALVRDPDTEVHHICGFLGTAFDPRAFAMVHASSIGKNACRVRDPGITSACDALLTRLDESWRRRLTEAGPGLNRADPRRA